MNISSIVVKCTPSFLADVIKDLEASGMCEIYSYDDKGRIVAIIEGTTTEEESEKLKTIQTIRHVLSAEMVYAYSENEFSAEEGKFEVASSDLIQKLNSDMPAEEIVYKGHLKDK